jgi:hypothetical protein
LGEEEKEEEEATSLTKKTHNFIVVNVQSSLERKNKE